MNIPTWFKRKRPQPVTPVKIDVRDLLVARWHGLTPEQWAEKPHPELARMRDAYAHAWGLGS